MSYKFETYKPRKIEFQQIVTINDWKIKVYSITNNTTFLSQHVLKNTIKELSIWLQIASNSKIQTYNNAFLIVHEAREGVWLLLNWWAGGEMIETKVYFANYNEPSIIKESPYNTSSLLCVWELEVFAHERKAWIKHVLKKADDPKFNDYLKDTL